MTENDTEVVSELRQQLADRVGQDRFELWFAGKTRIEFDGRTLTVFVPNRFHQDWLRSHFRGDVERAALDVAGSDIAVEFRVDRKLDVRKPSKPKTSAVASPADVQQTLPYAMEADSQSETTVPQNTAPAAPTGRRFARLDDFVIGESNRVAYTSVEMAAKEPGRVTPLLIHGPNGTGKTHLAEGLWSAIRKSDRNRRCVYLTSEQFTTFFLESLHGSGLPSFRRKHRGAHLLIIEDVQFLAGKRATLIELMSTIDALVRESAQVVMTADRPLADLKQLGPEFAGRMAGGLISSIEPPEFETRQAIVANMTRDIRMTVPRDVRHYLAKNFVGSVRQLSGAVNRLHATSLALNKPVDRTLAEHALADLVRHATPMIGLSQIETAVCQAFDLDPATLRSDSRVKSVAQPRMLAMWLARKHTRSALSEIGDHFGRRTHSTVISAQRKVDYWVNDGQQLHLAGRDWTAQEALDEIEQRLQRVG